MTTKKQRQSSRKGMYNKKIAKHWAMISTEAISISQRNKLARKVGLM